MEPWDKQRGASRLWVRDGAVCGATANTPHLTSPWSETARWTILPTFEASRPAASPPPIRNVFPFSANLASFMVIEMVRLTVAADWWPDAGGKLHYSMIPNRLQLEQARCAATCSVYETTAYGDLYQLPLHRQGLRRVAAICVEDALRYRSALATHSATIGQGTNLMGRITELQLRDVRCFDGEQSAKLGRITLLVG